MAAVCGFSSTMAAHLETIMNTVIQMTLDEKRSKRKSRQDGLATRMLRKEASKRYSLGTLSLVNPAAGVSPTRGTGVGGPGPTVGGAGKEILISGVNPNRGPGTSGGLSKSSKVPSSRNLKGTSPRVNSAVPSSPVLRDTKRRSLTTTDDAVIVYICVYIFVYIIFLYIPYTHTLQYIHMHVFIYIDICMHM
jgi:hypothetical protein